MTGTADWISVVVRCMLPPWKGAASSLPAALNVELSASLPPSLPTATGLGGLAAAAAAAGVACCGAAAAAADPAAAAPPGPRVPSPFRDPAHCQPARLPVNTDPGTPCCVPAPWLPGRQLMARHAWLAGVTTHRIKHC